MSRPLLSLNLRADFHSVAEGENHPAIRIDRRVIHKPVEQLLIEIHRQFPRLAESRKEATENVILDFLPLPLFFQAVHPALKGGVPAGIPVILFAVVVLVKFPGGVLIDQLLDQPRGHLHLATDRLHLCVNGTAVRQGFHDRPAVPDDLLTFLHQDADRLQEQLLYPLLVQMGRGAFAFAFELGVALPYRPLILAVGMPDLGAEVFAAVAAFQLCRERAAAVMAPPQVLPPLYLHLHELPLRRLDDGVMAALHIILRNFPFVRLALLGKEVHRVALLQAGIAFVLFVGKDVLHRPVPPGLLPRGRRDVPVRQIFRNGVGRLPLHEQPVDEPHRLRFFRHNFHLPFLPLPVYEEGTVGQADLAVRKPLPLPPCHVFGNGAGLFLRQRGHDGDEELALGVQRVDILFLEVDLHAFLLQLPNRGEAVHRVPCKPAHGLGDDEVYVNAVFDTI